MFASALTGRLVHDLIGGFRQKIGHLALDDVIRMSEPRRIEIAANLTEHGVSAGKIGRHDGFGIFFRDFLHQPQFGRSPSSQKLVAAGADLEAQFLVMSPLVLMFLFSLFERVGHLQPSERYGRNIPITLAYPVQ